MPVQSFSDRSNDCDNLMSLCTTTKGRGSHQLLQHQAGGFEEDRKLKTSIGTDFSCMTKLREYHNFDDEDLYRHTRLVTSAAELPQNRHSKS
ncbi:hypothetical protein C5167_036717 [Papaver somniferum]|uniref:Uncharacterized protein n=1 Tax=Papaver somniferum TaxID=3469 RepID=A0A4Y7I7H3_PAPSO|nr:hypothetical protein C5167_036717 [Papaver somniferum]